MNREKVSSGLRSFASFLLWMLVFGLVVRLFESALLAHYHLGFAKQLKINLFGFAYDVLFFSKAALVMCPVFLLINRFSEKAAKWTFRIIGTLMLLISNAMIMYFVAAYIPLDKIFFDYSISDLIYIASASEPFVWWGYVLLLLIPAAFLLLSRHEFSNGETSIFIWLLFAIAGLFVWEVPEKLYDNIDEKNTIDNKQAFFFGSLFSREAHFSHINAEDFEENRQRIREFHQLFPDVEFIDEKYPFAHIDKSPDVLSSFFNLDPGKKPNLVFLITEGLSSEFCGPNSIYPSPMPFFDSLASAGLAWHNCLSSTQRTYGVLPTLFGSLPFGDYGFMQSPNCPRFNSLIKILGRNGYMPSFFYGGWSCFDDMCYFLNDNGVNHFLPDYNTYPESMSNSWGLYDEYLFSESLKNIDFESDKTRIDIYLTLTTHDPFEFPNRDAYIEKYKRIVEEDQDKTPVKEYLFKCYASYSYFDDCLRKFFAAYRSKPDFENTIFIITGDHCFMSNISEFNKYLVPLVIWSPMLKDSREFPAMATHRDVTPSVLAMLKSSYGIETPDTVAWINTGLDTVSYFRSTTFSPQLKGSRIMGNMIFNDRFYDNGKVYKIGFLNNRLIFTPEENESMKHILTEYKALDDYVMNNDALLPENENNFMIASIDSTQSFNYVLTQTKVLSIDTLGEKHVFPLVATYPFDFAKIRLDSDWESVCVQCEFDIFIPKYEDDYSIHLDFSFGSESGWKTIKQIPINVTDYTHYGQWHHFSLTQRFEKSVYSYQDGDKISGFLVDGSNKKFFLANFRMKVIGSIE